MLKDNSRFKDSDIHIVMVFYVISAFIRKMLLQISVTKIHGISERFALIIKYLDNVADGDRDRAVAGAHCRPLDGDKYQEPMRT